MTNPYLSAAERRCLERVKIGIAGLGGLGSNAAAHLVRAGVRRLALCDFDTVDASNLNRQFFFRDQLGQTKVAALADNLRRIEPDLELELCDRRLDVAGVQAFFAGCDILIEALDLAATKALFYNAVLPWGRPVIGASGLAGFGRTADMRVKRLGNLYLVGDGISDVEGDSKPQSPRVGIAAAMEANIALALALDKEI